MVYKRVGNLRDKQFTCFILRAASANAPPLQQCLSWNSKCKKEKTNFPWHDELSI